MLTVGELFAGIGGFGLGLERAGMRVIWHAEIDSFASAVLRAHWPGVPNHGDVRSVRAGTVERPDVICGGFPCQDISVAGAGGGLEGERSGLWREFARIVGDLRPRYVIVENVGALTSRGLAAILGDLASFRYDAEWHVIPAAAVDAPHLRERCWIVAHDVADSDGGRREGERFAEHGAIEGASGDLVDQLGEGRRRNGADDSSDATRERMERHRPDRIEVAFAPALARLLGRDDAGAFWRDGPAGPALRRMDDGVPNRVDRLRCLGNSVVPQIVEIIGKAIVEADERR